MKLPPFVKRLPERLGFRVMLKGNAPRGTAPQLFTDVKERISPGSESALVDVGANKGDFTARMLEIFPEIPVHSFEPSPNMFRRLSDRFSEETRVKCHQFAIGTGTAELHFDPSPDEPGLARIIPEATSSSITVNVQSLDQFLAETSIDQIPLLKSDTEGNELKVLEGAAKALEDRKILSILVECSPGRGSERHLPLRSLQDVLEPLGFNLFGLYDQGYRSTGEMHYCNALFKLA